MKKFENNDWLTLNNLIYKIYTTEDISKLQEDFLTYLNLLIDFDGALFYLADAEGENLLPPVFYQCKEIIPAAKEAAINRGMLLSKKSIIYRDTDIISEENRQKTEHYKEYYVPNHWDYGLNMILAKDKKLLGFISLYRMIGKNDYQYDDIFLLEMLKDHLLYSLEKKTGTVPGKEKKLRISEAVEQFCLTNRETTILQSLMRGENTQEISEKLVLSSNTVKKHILNLYKKMGIKNRVQLFKMVKEYE